MKHVFLSYSRKDLGFVEKLAKDLQQAGYDVWYDLTDLEGGDRWASEIQAAIDQCDAFITVISPNSMASNWVEKEFLYASNAQKNIVPVLYVPSKLPLWLLDMHYLNIQGRNYKKNFPLVLAAIEDTKQPVAIPEPAKGLTALSPIWIGGIAGGVVLLLSAIFGLRALLGGVEPPSNSVATLNVLYTGAAQTLTGQASLVDSVTSTPSPTEAILFILTTPTYTLEPPTEVAATPTPAPAITDSKGVDMILVPAGSFKMGDEQAAAGEGPIHIVWLDAFYIDKYEVTNEQYGKCVEGDDLVCDLPTDKRAYIDPRFSKYPVTFATWEMAKTYCEWRGARLPTEAEWEKAARGTGLLGYPWGNKFDGKFVNFCDVNCSYDWSEKRYNDGYQDTAPVGSFEGGKSPYGLYDMSGNVMEWVADWYSESYYADAGSSVRNPPGPDTGTQRVLRGGSWFNNMNNVHTFTRTSLSPDKAYNYVGFRCVVDAAP